jgi:hypothetical protein
MAVVDTGAALTVISPELLQESQFVLRPWIGPRVVMANGEPATLLGAATISVNHIRGTATGEAVVFQMDGIDLILGNDFLRQYGKVQIDYREPKASITFEDQPLAAVTSVKWVTTADVPIPSFSVTNVRKDRPCSSVDTGSPVYCNNKAEYKTSIKQTEREGRVKANRRAELTLLFFAESA